MKKNQTQSFDCSFEITWIDLQISPRMFEKMWNDPGAIFRGLAEDDSWNKIWSKKSRDTVLLKSLSHEIDLKFGQKFTEL